MKRIGVRQLRRNASRYLALVKAGKTVEVTERGRFIALLSPPELSQGGRERLIRAGRLIPATNATGRLRAPRPVPIAAANRPTSNYSMPSATKRCDLSRLLGVAEVGPTRG